MVVVPKVLVCTGQPGCKFTNWPQVYENSPVLLSQCLDYKHGQSTWLRGLFKLCFLELFDEVKALFLLDLLARSDIKMDANRL